jgi:hypothetical protein
MGYVDNHGVVFTGYIKQVERKVPDDTIVLVASDVMVRAIDFFIASENPDEPLIKEHNIEAGDLITKTLNLASLTNIVASDTRFTFAVSDEVYAEANLVSAFDYAQSIANIITYHIYADMNGVVYIVNRKPFVVTSSSPWASQWGIIIDDITPSIADITVDHIISADLRVEEKDLRNRIVIYGGGDISYSAESTSSFDPLTGTSYQVTPIYKTAVLSASIIDTHAMAKQTGDYNLALYNKVGYTLHIEMLGNPVLFPRNTVLVTLPNLGLSSRMFYVYQVEHSWNRSWYSCSLELKL